MSNNIANKFEIKDNIQDNTNLNNSNLNNNINEYNIEINNDNDYIKNETENSKDIIENEEKDKRDEDFDICEKSLNIKENKIYKDNKLINNNIKNNLLDEKNLDEFPEDYDENFDDLYSIIKK